MDSLDQEMKRVAVLQAQGLHGGQQALDETTAIGAVTTKGNLPPQHAPTQDALGVIVGGLDAFADRELPKSRLQGNQIRAKVGRFAVGAMAPSVEQLAQASARRDRADFATACATNRRRETSARQ